MTARGEAQRKRVLVLAVSPEVDGGLYAAKAIILEPVVVSCDLLADGHDALGGALLYRPVTDRTTTEWTRVPLAPGPNDRWAASFVPDRLGVWEFTVEAWIDRFATWRSGTRKKLEARQNVDNELARGLTLLKEAAARLPPPARLALDGALRDLGDTTRPPEQRFESAAAEGVDEAIAQTPDLRFATRYERTLRVVVDPERARYSTWYELFPRSTGPAGRHGTLRDTMDRLPYIAGMGFDVLYLPPIHPIGQAFRKGPNNTLDASPTDVGSPWAIGSDAGGHTAVHPDLGTLEDLRALVAVARRHRVDLALDIAFQASPDHPYVKAHPDWFVHRADGSIQYAENPPKRYEDVYPFDFESEDWASLWRELLGVFLFWAEQGVRIFRVDNPHTKSLRFWEWCLGEVKKKHPDAIFLAEAFTRPKLMYALAKAGFSQSYTYFTWRHTREELTTYLEELTRPPVSDFFRPSFWPNTPDILPEHLQYGGRPTFLQRLLLAATLSSSYGIYGPPFELMEHVARAGSEEYVDNEKYQLRSWDVDREDSLREVVTLVNGIRREHAALQSNRIVFHKTSSEQLLAFSKRDVRGEDVLLVVISMDPQHPQAGWVDIDATALGLASGERFQVHDLLKDERYAWQGDRAYVALDSVMPGSIFKVRHKLRSEHDFEYFL